ncbi:MAG: M42 family metallopeptidase [Bacilli bacterium]|nr:M42 family metallopeptidase [Bacilli bacterium]
MINKYKEYAQKIFNISSPTGYTIDAIDYLYNEIKQLGFKVSKSNKGNLKVEIEGSDHSKVIATSAHVDTLGLMVRSIGANGTLKVTKIGGPLIPSLDGEYCVVRNREGKLFTGTILSTSPSVHVFSDASTKPRDIDNIEVRLDEIVKNSSDVTKLGISAGDFVFIDPKFTITDTGFVKSRFIDDKGCVAILMTILNMIALKIVKPHYDTIIYFVVHEEVGHGASVLDPRISEFVTMDMGCVGLDLNGDETKVSICAKDSNGPYDYELTNRLVNIAKANKIDYIVDIFPFYGSDIGAAYHAGYDIKGALIGPGVCASHGMERTHLKGVENSMKLMIKYLED